MSTSFAEACLNDTRTSPEVRELALGYLNVRGALTSAIEHSNARKRIGDYAIQIFAAGTQSARAFTRDDQTSLALLSVRGAKILIEILDKEMKK